VGRGDERKQEITKKRHKEKEDCEQELWTDQNGHPV
jgi:hypothetical protein